MTTDNARREFAAWKFQTIELLNIGLGHREARVAICLLSHMNRVTRLVKPSQRRVAILLGMDESAVRRAIKRLVEIGLLEVRRANRQASNHYSFSAAKLNEFYDLRRDREELARLSDREDVSAQKCPDGEETPGLEGEETPGPEREEVSPKPLKVTIEGNHQDSAMDEEDWDVEVLSPAQPLEQAQPARQARSDEGGQKAPVRISDALRNLRPPRKAPLASLNEQFGSDDFPPKGKVA